jgi:uncharacterized protein (TIGR02466 family)
MTERIHFQAHIAGVFETPITVAKVHDAAPLVAQLRELILAKRASHPGVMRSNVGGWHSEADMLEWGGDAAYQVADAAVRMAKRMTYFSSPTGADAYDWLVQMWANVSGPGSANLTHTHPGNLFACVFYVDFGGEANEETGGEFFLEDPRFPMSAMHQPALRPRGADGNPQRTVINFRQDPGDMIMFPAWMRHGVLAYRGTRERISIAINVDAQRKGHLPGYRPFTPIAGADG